MNAENAVMQKVLDAARAAGGALPWEDYIRICLYKPKLGYYASERRRVGGEGADFYTAASLKGKMFSELMAESAKNIFARAGEDLKNFEMAEIGAEPDSQMFENSKVFRLGDNIKIPPRCALFSNELLDARPFSRFKFQNGEWSEGFVKIEKSACEFCASEIFHPAKSRAEILEKYFPRAKVEGFRLDVSFDALKMFDAICAQDWRGVLMFADYFRSADELSTMPAGTARTYRAHRDGSDLFEHAGAADITFSPCADMFEDIARARGFRIARVERQEKFFMENAEDKIREAVLLKDPFNPRKRELCHLLSPAHMGSAFGILAAQRL